MYIISNTKMRFGGKLRETFALSPRVATRIWPEDEQLLQWLAFEGKPLLEQVLGYSLANPRLTSSRTLEFLRKPTTYKPFKLSLRVVARRQPATQADLNLLKEVLDATPQSRYRCALLIAPRINPTFLSQIHADKKLAGIELNCGKLAGDSLVSLLPVASQHWLEYPMSIFSKPRRDYWQLVANRAIELGFVLQASNSVSYQGFRCFLVHDRPAVLLSAMRRADRLAVAILANKANQQAIKCFGEITAQQKWISKVTGGDVKVGEDRRYHQLIVSLGAKVGQTSKPDQWQEFIEPLAKTMQILQIKFTPLVVDLLPRYQHTPPRSKFDGNRWD